MLEGDRKNRKSWIYFKEMSFLSPHVELYRLNDSVKSNEQQQEETVYSKEDYLERILPTDEKQQIYFEDDENQNSSDGITYQIRIDSEYDDEEVDQNEEEDENHLFENNYVEERLEDGTIMGIEEDQVVVNKVIQRLGNDEHTYMILEANEQNSEGDRKPVNLQTIHHQQQQNSSSPNENEKSNSSTPSATLSSSSLQIQNIKSIASPGKNVVDPDERYLLSCLPAFKRLNHQQKAYLRLGIERLFYEVEFENISEPKNKRSRNS